jgi:NAD(P)-dependent dehydrogenase (short-subunit alcohol dehydrogenase family)
VQWTGRYRIRVNALAPGFLTTEMTADARDSDRTLEAILAHTPLGRLGDPAEIIGPVLLLASDAGSYITGATLAVDGGWTLH